MGKSINKFKAEFFSGRKFCSVSLLSTGANGSTGIATAEYDNGVLIISASSASATEKLTLKNFPFKFEIIDGYVVTRQGRLLKNMRIMKNTVSPATTLIMTAVSIKTAKALTRATTLDAANTVIDKTDRIQVRITSGTANASFSFRAYLNVIPART